MVLRVVQWLGSCWVAGRLLRSAGGSPAGTPQRTIKALVMIAGVLRWCSLSLWSGDSILLSQTLLNIGSENTEYIPGVFVLLSSASRDVVLKFVVVE